MHTRRILAAVLLALMLHQAGCTLILGPIVNRMIMEPPDVNIEGKTICIMPFTDEGKHPLASKISIPMAEQAEYRLLQDAPQTSDIVPLGDVLAELQERRHSATSETAKKTWRRLFELSENKRTKGFDGVIERLKAAEVTHSRDDLRKVLGMLKEMNEPFDRDLHLVIQDFEKDIETVGELPWKEIGGKVGAQIVCTGRILKFSTRNPDVLGMNKGRLVMRVHVYDMDLEGREIFNKRLDITWPTTEFDDAAVLLGEGEIKDQLIFIGARLISNIFIVHEIEGEGPGYEQLY